MSTQMIDILCPFIYYCGERNIVYIAKQTRCQSGGVDFAIMIYGLYILDSKICCLFSMLLDLWTGDAGSKV